MIWEFNPAISQTISSTKGSEAFPVEICSSDTKDSLLKLNKPLILNQSKKIGEITECALDWPIQKNTTHEIAFDYSNAAFYVVGYQEDHLALINLDGKIQYFQRIKLPFAPLFEVFLRNNWLNH